MFSNISVVQLLIILAIIILLFGTKRLGSLGKDLGSAIRGFKDSVREGEKDQQVSQQRLDQTGTTLDAEGKPVKEQDKV